MFPSVSQQSSSLHGMDRIIATVVKDSHFYINTELGHHLPVIQLVSFLE
jgi:hypothetical protein